MPYSKCKMCLVRRDRCKCEHTPIIALATSATSSQKSKPSPQSTRALATKKNIMKSKPQVSAKKSSISDAKPESVIPDTAEPKTGNVPTKSEAIILQEIELERVRLARVRAEADILKAKAIREKAKWDRQDQKAREATWWNGWGQSRGSWWQAKGKASHRESAERWSGEALRSAQNDGVN